MYFVNLKSDSALKSNKGHNLLRVFPSNNVKKFIATIDCSRLELNALLVLCHYHNGKEISSQEDAQGIKFTKVEIKCCKEKNDFPPNKWPNIPFF